MHVPPLCSRHPADAPSTVISSIGYRVRREQKKALRTYYAGRPMPPARVSLTMGALPPTVWMKPKSRVKGLEGED